MHREEGSITLEAALILPFVMTLMLAFMMCIQMLMIEMELQSAASDTVKSIAAHLYIVQLTVDSKAADRIRDKLDTVTDPLDQWDEWIRSFEDLLPESIQELLLIQELLADQTSSGIEYVASHVLKPILMNQIHSPWIDRERVTISAVDLPWVRAGNHEYFGFTVQYIYPLRLPFYQKDMIIEVAAYERAWIGG